MAEETKNDLFLKRVQITIAILGGLTALILGIYNINKNIFSKQDQETAPMKIVEIHERVVTEPIPSVPAPAASQTPQVPTKIQSALEDVGASWIKKLTASDPQAPQSQPASVETTSSSGASAQ